MNTTQKTTNTEKKALLSTLWLFGLLNVIFRDIHEFFRPGLLEEITTGRVNGAVMTEETMLMTGVSLEILIVMVLLSRVLPQGVNRWANLVVGVLAITYVVADMGVNINDLDDLFFAAMELIALSSIIWLAWRWREPDGVATSDWVRTDDVSSLTGSG